MPIPSVLTSNQCEILETPRYPLKDWDPVPASLSSFGLKFQPKSKSSNHLFQVHSRRGPLPTCIISRMHLVEPPASQLGARVSLASFHRQESRLLGKSRSSTCWGNFGPGPRVSVSSVSPHRHSLSYSCFSLSFSMSFRSWAVSFPVDDWGLHPKASGHFIPSVTSLFCLLSPFRSSAPSCQPVPCDRNGKALLTPQDISPSPFRLHIFPRVPPVNQAAD